MQTVVPWLLRTSKYWQQLPKSQEEVKVHPYLENYGQRYRKRIFFFLFLFKVYGKEPHMGSQDGSAGEGT